jgi:hypothetical protein
VRHMDGELGLCIPWVSVYVLETKRGQRKGTTVMRVTIDAVPSATDVSNKPAESVCVYSENP